jgi:hypothetical protein
MMGTTWPWIHPHSYVSLVEWFDLAADKAPQEVCAYQPTSYQLLDDLTLGL